MIIKIPKEVIEVLQKLEQAGFEAHIVGGCVRDLLMNKKPKDWDITTGAKPEKIQKIFPDSFYENKFGTVGIKTEKFINGENLSPDRDRDIIEATTFRVESEYSDKRHPDQVKFAKTIEEDLGRRDFAINAIALKISNQIASSRDLTRKNLKNSEYEIENYQITDPYGGQKDIRDKIIRAVGDPRARFEEDALRMMRAVRFHAELGFAIEQKTAAAIKKQARDLRRIAPERIKDEFARIIVSDGASEGIDALRQTGLLQYIVPELEEGVGIRQNRHHIHTIYKHGVLSLKNCPSKKLEVRLAALFHDIAKPQTKRGEGPNATFYNHDHVGARVTEKILFRLRFPKEVVQKVKLLVDNHMFYYNPDEVGPAMVRRLIKKVGLTNINDLIAVRVADRLGSGVPKAKPYKLRHLEYMIDKVSSDAISVKMLKIDGRDLMEGLNLKPGPKIGAILDVLLAEVIEDNSKNEKKLLLSRAKKLTGENMEKLREMAREKIEEKEEEEDKEIKSKYWLK